MELLINVANVLYLLSYFVKDMLSLRIFTTTAASCLTACFYLQPEPLMVAVYWNSLFIAVNIIWSVRLLQVRLTRRQIPIRGVRRRFCRRRRPCRDPLPCTRDSSES